MNGFVVGTRFMRIGEDPIGRGERTLYYETPSGGGECYVWLVLLSPQQRRQVDAWQAGGLFIVKDPA